MNILRAHSTASAKRLFRSKQITSIFTRNTHIYSCIAAGGLSNILCISSQKTAAICQPVAIPAPPVVTPSLPTLMEDDASVWNTVKKGVKWVVDLIKLLTRLGLLGLYFTPAVAASPVLLTGSESLRSGWWDLVRYAIHASGPCLTKFAQWAATRPDIFEAKMCKELEFLQAQSFQHSWRATDRILKNVYGKDWQTRLKLDKESVTGSGLVAQVYHGYLLDEEQRPMKEVAVKVVHPRVKAAMLADLALMRYVAHCTEDMARLVSYLWRGGANCDGDHLTNRESVLETTISLSEAVEEFSDLMQGQLNLKKEGDSMIRFRKNFANKKWENRVTFAEPVYMPGTEDAKETAYSQDVLIETFERGQPMAEFLRDRDVANPSAKDKEIAALGLDIILKMIFDDNFIHGDLHPGNLLLNGSANEPGRLTVLDTGLCTELKPQDRKNLLLLFKAVLDRDGSQVGRLIIEKSRCRRSRQRVIAPEEFEKSMQKVIDDAFQGGLTPGNRGISKLLSRVLQLCYKHRVRLESGFASVILSVGVVEGLGMQLDPSIDILSRAGPFILKAAARDFGLI